MNLFKPRSGDQTLAQGVRGCCPTYGRQLPSSAEEGWLRGKEKSCEATLARADGVVLIRIMIFLTSTTPAAATASAFPSSAEEGSCDSRVCQQPLTPWGEMYRNGKNPERGGRVRLLRCFA